MNNQQLTGPDVAFSVSNKFDLKRFCLPITYHVQWGERWIEERLSKKGDVGVLVHGEDDFYFDTYAPIKQPIKFYNLIRGNGAFFSQLYFRTARHLFSQFDKIETAYSDICCPMLLHALSEKDMAYFFERSADLLQEGGNLILCFSCFFPCDYETKSILQNAQPLRNRNKHVKNRIGFGEFSSLIRNIYNGKWIFAGTIPCYSPLFLNAVFSDPDVCKQNCLKIFSTNYSHDPKRELQVSKETDFIVVGVQLKKNGKTDGTIS